MSIRYVYEKWNSVVENNYSASTTSSEIASFGLGIFHTTKILSSRPIILGGGSIDKIDTTTGEIITLSSTNSTITSTKTVEDSIWAGIMDSKNKTYFYRLSYPYIEDPDNKYQYTGHYLSLDNSGTYWKIKVTYRKGVRPDVEICDFSKETPRKNTTYNKGTTKYGNISTSTSSMTNTSSYYYVKLGSDSIDAVSVSANKSQVISGESITVTVSPSKTITYGGTISYLYQYSKDGGSTWKDISTSISTSIQFEAPISTADYTLKFRVRSLDNMGFTSTDYILSQNIGVTINNPPSFNVSGSNLGTVSEPIVIDYIVSDVENDDINVTESIDDVIIRTYKPVLGQSNTFKIEGQKWNKLLNGVHKVTISASDINNSTSIQEWTFIKIIDSVELTLSTPLEAADIIHRTILNVERKVPEGAEFRVYACNNGFDKEPAWEEMTSAVLREKKFFFSNATKTATKWGYNLKIILQRNNTQGDCYISGIGGNFE